MARSSCILILMATEESDLKQRILALEVKVGLLTKIVEDFRPLSGSTAVLDAISSFRIDNARRFEGIDNRLILLEDKIEGLYKGMNALLNYWKIGSDTEPVS